jgi:type VI secretion system protein ImpG
MSEALLPYYNRELDFIRHLAQDFKRQYPKVANRLGLEPNQSTDPHVERLIQAFALMAGRIHHKLDDEFPELTDALLGVLYPHYLAPVPSMAVVQFEVDPVRTELPSGFTIPRHSQLLTQAINGLRCRYRTGNEVKLWPVGLVRAELKPPPFLDLRPPPETAAVLRLSFQCQSNLTFNELQLEWLRLFLYGQSNQVTAELYELLFTQTLKVGFLPLDAPPGSAPLEFKPEECLRPVGFERDEGLLPYPEPSFLGYRLLTEYFAFPAKFHFIDLGGWAQAATAGFRRRCDVIFYLGKSSKELERSVKADTFRLGCTPTVNLFERVAEPIVLTQSKHEYPIVPDVHYPLGLEIYSVNAVTSGDPGTGEIREYHPFYSFRHGESRRTRRALWCASRRPAMREEDRGTDVFLSLTDLDFNPSVPSEPTLVVHTTCTNRDLPVQLTQAGEEVVLELEMAAPVRHVHCLGAPTPPLRPSPQRRGSYWRLISHLSLNHLSLVEGNDALDALRELLGLYNFWAETGQQADRATLQVIEGITRVESRRIVAQTGWEISSGFARGTEVTITFDEPRFVGTGLYLFASVLERFLGLYVSVNSFMQLVAVTEQRQEPLRRWPPRAGERPLL